MNFNAYLHSTNSTLLKIFFSIPSFRTFIQVVGGLDIHKKMVVDVWALSACWIPPFVLDSRFLHHLWRSAQDVRQNALCVNQWKYSLSFSLFFFFLFSLFLSLCEATFSFWEKNKTKHRPREANFEVLLNCKSSQ